MQDVPLTALLRPVTLPAADIEVWLMPLAVPALRVEQCAALLSPDEQARAQHFHFERDRRRYTVARGILRVLLGHALARAPDAVRFEYSRHGKPRLTGNPTPLHFNVSHSADMAIYAISRTRIPGVDIEHLDREIDVGALAARFFTPGERAELERMPAAEQKRALLFTWTRKEAIVKSLGDGLRLALDQIEVTVSPDTPPAVLKIVRGSAADWRLYPVHAGPEYAATVAAHRAA